MSTEKNLSTVTKIGTLLISCALGASAMAQGDPSPYRMTIPSKVRSLGIAGDSGTTGVATDPGVYISTASIIERAEMQIRVPRPKLDFSVFTDPEYFNITPETLQTRPQRIFPKVNGAKQNPLLERTAKNIFWNMIDTPEFSFGYAVGQKLKVPTPHIVFVGENGARVEHTFDQFERLTIWSERAQQRSQPGFRSVTGAGTYAPTRQLPDAVLLSYTGNDFCGKKNLRLEPGTMQISYQKALAAQLTKITQELAPATDGTDIYVLGALDLIQTVNNEDLLSTEINFAGKTLTCKKLRAEPQMFLGKPAKFLSSECKGLFLFDEGVDREAQIAKVDSLYREVVAAQEGAVRELQQANPKGFRVHFVDATSKLRFIKGDVAADCFHPSAQGHSRIARVILKAIGAD